MKIIFSKYRLGIFIVVSACLLWAGVFVLISDRQVLPEVEMALKSAQTLPKSNENAYIAILELESNAGKNTKDSIYSYYDSERVDNHYPPSEEQEDKPSGVHFAFDSKYGFCFDPATPKYEGLCGWSSSRIENVWNANKLIIQNFERILKYPKFHPTEGAVSQDLLIGFGQAAALNAIYQIKTGDLNAAYKTTISSIKFWRRVLNSPIHIVTRTIAYIGISRSLRVLAYLLQHADVPSEMNLDLLKTLRPNSYANGLEQTMMGELLLIDSFKKNPDESFGGGINRILGIPKSEPGIVKRLSRFMVFKPNATLNLIYQMYHEASQPQRMNCGKTENNTRDTFLSYFYNRAGNLLVDRRSMQQIIHFEIRLRGRLQLARTVYELQKERIGIQNVHQYSGNDSIRKHYSGELVNWNKDKNRLELKLGDTEYCDVWITKN